MAKSFDFQIPGLTDAEEDVADAFVNRMHEIAQEEGAKLDLWGDGGPVLVRIVNEKLPHYTLQEKSALMLKVLEGIGGALDLHKKPTEGNA
jgi:hypothetical protein